MLFFSFASFVLYDWRSVSQSKIARRSPSGYVAGHLDHLAPALRALPRSLQSVWQEIRPETVKKSVFLASGHWVPSVRAIQLFHPNAMVVVLDLESLRREMDEGNPTPSYCREGKVLVNFLFPDVAEAWAMRHQRACAAAGSKILLPSLATLRKLDNTVSFSAHMLSRHPRLAVRTYQEPRVPCVVKNTSRDGNGKGVTLIETAADLAVWRELYRIRVEERGWRGGRTHIVIQEPIRGRFEYGVSAVACDGHIVALAAYRTTSLAASLFVYGAGSHELHTEAFLAGEEDNHAAGGSGVGATQQQLPPEIMRAVEEVVAGAETEGTQGLDGFINFDIKLREEEGSSGGGGPAEGALRPVFLETNMRVAGAWFKAGSIGKAVEAYYQCALSKLDT